jgi:hypothetical protein
MGPLWAHTYRTHIGSACGAFIESATGFGMGPIWAAPYRMDMGLKWVLYGHIEDYTLFT